MRKSYPQKSLPSDDVYLRETSERSGWLNIGPFHCLQQDNLDSRTLLSPSSSDSKRGRDAESCDLPVPSPFQNKRAGDAESCYLPIPSPFQNNRTGDAESCDLPVPSPFQNKQAGDAESCDLPVPSPFQNKRAGDAESCDLPIPSPFQNKRTGDAESCDLPIKSSFQNNRTGDAESCAMPVPSPFQNKRAGDTDSGNLFGSGPSQNKQGGDIENRDSIAPGPSQDKQVKNAEHRSLLGPAQYHSLGCTELLKVLNSVSLDSMDEGQFVYTEDIPSDEDAVEYDAGIQELSNSPPKCMSALHKISNFRDRMWPRKTSSDSSNAGHQPYKSCNQNMRKCKQHMRRDRMLQIFRRSKGDKLREAMWLLPDGMGVYANRDRNINVESLEPHQLDMQYSIEETDVEGEYVMVDKKLNLPESNSFSLKIRYEDIQNKHLIGHGGFGIVYEAELKGKQIALKEVAPHRYQQEQGNVFIESLLSELKLLQKLGQHPHVVECYGGCLEAPHVFMVSRLMERSLGDLIYGGRNSPGIGALPAKLALGITLDILYGLDHLHCADEMVVHRDLKPQNILLDKDNRAMVTDFGMSRVKAGRYVQTLNVHAGTPAYLGPEVGLGKIDEKLDIFAAGVILWECLTARHPWEGYHPFGIHMLVCQGERLDMPENVFSGNESSVTYEIRKIIELCWQELPSDRPNCKALIEQLQQLLSRFFGDYEDQLPS